MTRADLEQQVVSFEHVMWKEKSRAAEQQLMDEVSSRQKGTTGQPTSSSESSRFKNIKFDFLIGADGKYSSVRQSMMRYTPVDFSQYYESAVWCDFIIPPKANGDYPMNVKCLHLWPANENILVAQPDLVRFSELPSPPIKDRHQITP